MQSRGKDNQKKPVSRRPNETGRERLPLLRPCDLDAMRDLRRPVNKLRSFTKKANATHASGFIPNWVPQDTQRGDSATLISTH